MVNQLTILGVMSGTSLDGLDLAICQFQKKENAISFKLLASKTINYSIDWKLLLAQAPNLSAEKYAETHALYGKFIAQEINTFLTNESFTVDYISSHGHTIFHQPALGFTSQLGCGATIKALTGIATICDFRSIDVALGGQGAPLVPIGDRDLFTEHESCLNIGGIANISFQKDGKIIAFDICFANMLLNELTQQIGKDYDDKGLMSSTGTINADLYKQLLSIDTNNKSLGREFFESSIWPLINNSINSIEDKLATGVEYTAFKIAEVLTKYQLHTTLVTGGGAYNDFLISRIGHFYKGVITIPHDEIIQFKEALIFAYLGYLKINNKPNTLSSVTGAKTDSIGGCLY